MKLRVTGDAYAADLPVIVLVGADGMLAGAAAELDRRSGGLVARALAAGDGLPIKHGRILHLMLPAGLPHPHLLIVGLGTKELGSPLELEELGGSLIQRLRSLKAKAASLASPEGPTLPLGAAATMAAIARGAALQAHRFGKYRGGGEDEDRPAGPGELVLVAGAAAAEVMAELPAIEGLASAVARTRDLVIEPANVLGPAELAAACRTLEGLGVEVEVLDVARLEALGMRALLAVGQGSVRPPCAAIMRWKGAEGAPLALVGKGVVFDTGGISIKPAAGMEDMKGDMAGAAAVIGTMAALASRRAPAHVVGLVGIAENMPSGSAIRPGDIVRAMSGKTIEIINTDAEGRLVLADMIWHAKESLQPRAIIDLATLTGAIVVALGHERAGLFSTDETLAARLAAAGDAVGERLWRMPLGKEYSKHIRSEIADIKNVGRSRQAGATAGAVFLQEFVGEVPWAHLDIAGVSWSGRDSALAPKGPTGFGVRLLDRLVADMFEVGR